VGSDDQLGWHHLAGGPQIGRGEWNAPGQHGLKDPLGELSADREPVGGEQHRR
jgi:hypothetical protein